AIKDVLENDPGTDKPLSIISHVPYAPLEIATLPLGKDGEFLGARRPVLRWPEIAHASPARAQFDALLCIRPTYLGDDALPNALKEEEFLKNLLPTEEKRRHACTHAELKPHLDDGSIHAIHFAGHAQTDPALLKLEGGGHVTAAFFFQTTQLMSK